MGVVSSGKYSASVARLPSGRRTRIRTNGVRSQSHTRIVSGHDGLPDSSLEVASTSNHTPARLRRRAPVSGRRLELVEEQLGEEMVVAVPLTLLSRETTNRLERASSRRSLSEPAYPSHVAKRTVILLSTESGAEMPHFLGEARQDLLSQEADDCSGYFLLNVSMKMLVTVMQGEGGEVESQGHLRYARAVRRGHQGRCQAHLFVQQAGGFLL